MARCWLRACRRAIWAIPEDVKQFTPAQLDALAKLLEMPAADLRHRVDEDKNFVYLKRQVSMEAADKIKQLGAWRASTAGNPPLLSGRRRDGAWSGSTASRTRARKASS